MDRIQQWLSATDNRVPPPPSDSHRIPDATWADARSQEGQQRRGRAYRRRKRKRASSDSSIIAPRPADRRHAYPPPLSLPNERPRSPDHAEASHAVSVSSASRSSSPGREPQKTYERRPRHKTRPDRYEPKSKKPEADREARREKKPKNRRKSHGGADGGRTAGLVQSFQLKNGPKASRLTIKPGASAGLFKHGRASAQVTGRGSGLPDLVFNEMRFLQQPTRHQDEPAEAPDKQKRSKQDRRRPNDGEISAYFSAKQPAREQQKSHGPPDQNHDRERVTQQPARRDAERHRHAPSVELPSHPFLGFGSRGPQPDSKDTFSNHTSYLSCSETPQPEAREVERRVTSAPSLDADELSVRARDSRAEQPPKHQRESHREKPRIVQGDQAQPSVKPPSRASRSKREGSAINNVDVPRAERMRHHLDARRSVTKTTSQSLPRQVAPQAHGQDDHAARGEDFYHTSDILKLHADTELHTADMSEVVPPAADKENEDPASTLFIDRLLDDVRHAVKQQALEPAPKPDRRAGQEHEDPGGDQVLLSPRAASADLPVRGESVTFSRGQYPARPSAPLQQKHSIVRTTHRTPSRRISLDTAQHRANTHFGPPSLTRVRPAPYSRSGRSRTPTQEDGGMLRDAPGLNTHPWLHEPVYASLQEAEDLAFDINAHATQKLSSKVYEDWSEQLASEATSLWHQTERMPSNAMLGRTSLGRPSSMGRSMAFESIGPAREVAAVDMSGFWKPNKLY